MSYQCILNQLFLHCSGANYFMYVWMDGWMDFQMSLTLGYTLDEVYVGYHEAYAQAKLGIMSCAIAFICNLKAKTEDGARGRVSPPSLGIQCDQGG